MPDHAPSPPTAREILVVIPALDEAQHIERTLAMLFAEAPDMDNVTIIVADGGSRDGTRDIVRAIARDTPNLHLLANPGRLQSAGVNLAVARYATPDHAILVRVDAHSHYPPGYVLQVAKTLVARDVDAVATVMDPIAETCFQKGLAAALGTPLGTGGSGHRGGQRSGFVDHGHHAGIRISRFRELGGYDPDLPTNEDAEFDHRLRRAGGRIWLDAGIRLGYVLRATPGQLARQYWRYGQGRARTLLRHRIRPRARQVIPAAATGANLACLALGLVAPGFLVVPLAYLLTVLGTGGALAVKARDPCALWAGPALAIMHSAWGAGLLWQIIRQRGRAA